ncbi:para-nitrobenzyl esterase chain A [Staphylococcus saccharolyticus]|uniref:Para-nitrobenzyl esterase chain A n=1 Tax=Staphylococcus saccharolyticus TaxID=33028 RepID=A0A380H0D3_9STAP|nr:para-nitrobenzyl esterase chain A [Staphylococcus saccharolyticus]
MDTQKLDRGKSRGLDLIYQPIEDSHMMRAISDFPMPVFISYTHDEGDIYIKEDSRKLPPARFVEIMHTNKVNITKNDVKTAHQQRQTITQYYFKLPAINTLNQLNAHHKWLARFDWCQSDSLHFKSAYHILDVAFWFGNLAILSENDFPITQHETNLSRQMINDLAYFATYGRMPWKQYRLHHPYKHIYK